MARKFTSVTMVLVAILGLGLLACHDSKGGGPPVNPDVRIGEGVLDEQGGTLNIGAYVVQAVAQETFSGPVTVTIDRVQRPGPLPDGDIAVGDCIRLSVQPPTAQQDYLFVLFADPLVWNPATHLVFVVSWDAIAGTYHEQPSSATARNTAWVAVTGERILQTVLRPIAVATATASLADSPPSFRPDVNGFVADNIGEDNIAPEGMCLGMAEGSLAYRDLYPTMALYTDLRLAPSYALALACGAKTDFRRTTSDQIAQLFLGDGSVVGRIRHLVRTQGACVLGLTTGALSGYGHAGVVFAEDAPNNRFLLYDANEPGQTQYIGYSLYGQAEVLNHYGPYIGFASTVDPQELRRRYAQLIDQVSGITQSTELAVVDPPNNFVSPVEDVVLTMTNSVPQRDWVVMLRSDFLYNTGKGHLPGTFYSEAYDGTIGARLEYGNRGDFFIVSAKNIAGQSWSTAGSTIARWSGVAGDVANVAFSSLPGSITVRPKVPHQPQFGLEGTISVPTGYALSFTCSASSFCERPLHVGWRYTFDAWADATVHPGGGFTSVTVGVIIHDPVTIDWFANNPGGHVGMPMTRFPPFLENAVGVPYRVYGQVTPAPWNLQVYADLSQ